MADNVIIPASGTGTATPNIATDDVGGVQHQRVKVEWGADGVATDTSAANPLPTVQTGALPAGTNNIGDVDVLTLPAVTGTVTANIGTVGTLATESTQTAQSTLYGAVTESAPASDTASSGLNGRLQRIAQRLTSLIALLPASLGQKTMANGLAVTIASDQSSIPVATTPPANASTNMAQVAGTATDTNSGNKSAGTQRVVIATDQPALTTPMPVADGGGSLTIDGTVTTTPPANASSNVSQINGVTPLMGTGNTGTGSLRVTLATDQTQLTNALKVDPSAVTSPISQANPVQAATATLANVAGSASSVTLQASNGARKGLVIVNDSTAILYVKFGSSASTTSFTYYLAGSVGGTPATLELPAVVYTGIVTGIWASAVGSARMTELT